MVRRLLFRYSGNLPCRFIEIDGQPYLERYYLGRVLGTTFYLHRFVGADGDRQVHDHPWKYAAAVVLSGWYVEERVTHLDVAKGWASRFRTLWPGRINRLGPSCFHKILETRPDTWTLFAHGPYVKVWGFLNRSADRTFYHQPFDVSKVVRWWERAPKGRDACRFPLQG